MQVRANTPPAANRVHGIGGHQAGTLRIPMFLATVGSDLALPPCSARRTIFDTQTPEPPGAVHGQPAYLRQCRARSPLRQLAALCAASDEPDGCRDGGAKSSKA